MRQTVLAFIIVIFPAALIPLATHSSAQTTVETVRRMCTAPDNQDFTVFDQELLPEILIEIIQDDPPDSPYHERVVSSALKALGALHVPEAVEVLIGKLDEYPTACLYWLGTYASSDSVAAIAEYVTNDDPSLRCEAAEALGRLPDPQEDDEDYTASLIEALNGLGIAIAGEEDEAVSDALEEAWAHVASIVLQSGTAAYE